MSYEINNAFLNQILYKQNSLDQQLTTKYVFHKCTIFLTASLLCMSLVSTKTKSFIKSINNYAGVMDDFENDTISIDNNTTTDYYSINHIKSQNGVKY